MQRDRRGNDTFLNRLPLFDRFRLDQLFSVGKGLSTQPCIPRILSVNTGKFSHVEHETSIAFFNRPFAGTFHANPADPLTGQPCRYWPAGHPARGSRLFPRGVQNRVDTLSAHLPAEQCPGFPCHSRPLAIKLVGEVRFQESRIERRLLKYQPFLTDKQMGRLIRTLLLILILGRLAFLSSNLRHYSITILN